MYADVTKSKTKPTVCEFKINQKKQKHHRTRKKNSDLKL